MTTQTTPSAVCPKCRSIDVHQLIELEQQRDPIPLEQRQFGHVYFVAEPTEKITSQNLFAPDNVRVVSGVIRRGDEADNCDIPGAFGMVHANAPRGNGWGFYNAGAMDGARNVNDLSKESFIADVEVTRNGGIRVLLGGGAGDARGEGASWINDALILSYSRHLFAWIAGLSAAFGYDGGWELGVRAEGVKGLRSHLAEYRGIRAMMDREVYVDELTIAPGGAVQATPAQGRALVQQLLTTLNTDGIHPNQA